jgi:hypothetical protein
MASEPGFSFLRLGDIELFCLLAAQDGTAEDFLQVKDGLVDGTMAYGVPGIGLEYALPLRQAYEQASYVDFHERLWPVGKLLPKLRLACRPRQHRNSSIETSYILLTWIEREFCRFCAGRRVGFAGAEASLLEHLQQRPAFAAAAATVWPADADVFFHQIREDGRNVSANFCLIKDDLRHFIRTTRIDTLFLSLGGAAKILCVDLAAELGIRMFDGGSMLRALTYSGSDGNRTTRSTHFPFLYRIPFDVWCDAMDQSWPDLQPHERLAKAHAQLILEIQKKEVGWTHSSAELDLGQDNLSAFAEAHHAYLARYQSLFKASAAARQERCNFLHFCGAHGLTHEGRRFYRTFRVKSLLRSVWP